MMTTWDNSYWWLSPPEIVCKVPPGEVGCCGRAQFIPWATVQCIFSLCGAIFSPIPHLVESNVLGDVLGKLGGVAGLSRYRHYQSDIAYVWFYSGSFWLSPKRQKMRNLSERLKNLFWSLFITMIDLIVIKSYRIIFSGCNNTWRWSDQRLPWRSRQTASLSDTPSRSLECPR